MPDTYPSEDMPYEEFLAFINDLSEPIPGNTAVLQILLDAISSTIADLEFNRPESRTPEAFLVGVEARAQSRIKQVSLESTSLPAEAEEVVLALGKTVLRYRHERFFEMGQSLPRCSLKPPCRFHPTP